MTSAESLLINKILNDALEKKASDIHLTVGNYPVMRVAGNLIVITEEQILTPDFIHRMAESFLTDSDKAQLDKTRSMTVVYTWADRARFRAQVFYQKGYPAISLRLIPQRIVPAKDLGLSSVIIGTIERPRGVVLVAGPYNSGRTTTVFSLMEQINLQQGKHIQTLEKPIEYLMINNKSVIDQREVGRDVPSFIQGLEEAAEKDVQVVVVGEMEESGQAEAVLKLVESGKLVYVIINSLTVVAALESFISGFSDSSAAWAREALSQDFIAATAQRLVPQVGGGLVLAYEILTNSASIKNSIKEGNFFQLNNVILTSRQDGMITLDRHLTELVKTGQVAPEDAMRFALEPSSFKQMINKQ